MKEIILKVLKCGIYAIFDSKTSDCLYVGQSQDIDTRWKKHIITLKNKTHRQADFIEWFYHKDCSIDSMSFVIIELCDNKDDIKNSLEIFWFDKLNPKFFGVKPSLKNTWNHTEKTKEKISKTLLKKFSNTDTLINRVLSCGFCKSEFKSRRKSVIFCSNICASNYKTSKYYPNDLIKFENEVCNSYVSGLSLRKCEKVHNISYVTVRKILLKHGIILRGH